METHRFVTAGQAALDANMAAFFGAYAQAPGGTLLDRSGNVMYYSGIPHALFNGAIIGRDDAADILAIEAELATQIERHGAPALWWIGIGAHTASIEHRLPALGLAEAGTIPAMACEIAALPRPPAVTGLFIEEARDREARIAWAALAGRGTGFDEAASAALAETEGHIPAEALAGQRRFTGYLAGKAVASIALVTTGTVAGIHAVATLPDARGRGIAPAMTMHALEEAARDGARTGVLTASETGRRVYLRMGFTEIFDYLLYRQS